jgi:hypothetical protein
MELQTTVEQEIAELHNEIAETGIKRMNERQGGQ